MRMLTARQAPRGLFPWCGGFGSIGRGTGLARSAAKPRHEAGPYPAPDSALQSCATRRPTDVNQCDTAADDDRAAPE